ncbi:mechanosensitive ion channel family protein [Variovorax sp. HJSM1_2]|uniref:mechanosensitive ion channel family protein n=1 Tax=Variovorax sp. HJSM1_2 TaxID=3366263 RepID=UPI003BCEDB33
MHNMDWAAFMRLTDEGLLLALTLALVAGLVIHRVGLLVLRRVTRTSVTSASLVEAIRAPTQVLLPLAAISAVLHGASSDFPLIGPLRYFSELLLVVAVTWLGTSIIRGVTDGILLHYPLNGPNSFHARRIHTRTRVLARTLMVLVWIIGTALILRTVPGARQIGTSLLASAGVAGLVVGIAARSVFSNLLAGLQIALTQPIRLDDVLIVQGEWGRVSEITGTYVVLAIWDERRLIIPLQWFIENPFQNWTRHNADLIGSVFLWTDFRLPMAPLRAEALRICQSSPDWDGRLCKVQITDTNERAMRVRVLATSSDSDKNWDLRCAVREGLLDFIQREYPQCLPLVRTEPDERTPPAALDLASGA